MASMKTAIIIKNLLVPTNIVCYLTILGGGYHCALLQTRKLGHGDKKQFTKITPDREWFQIIGTGFNPRI